MNPLFPYHFQPYQPAGVSRSIQLHPKIVGLWQLPVLSFDASNVVKTQFLATMEFPEDEYSAPRSVAVLISLHADSPTVDMETLWLGKKPTRNVESTAMVFEPLPEQIRRCNEPGAPISQHWDLHKLGSLVDGTNIVVNGSQRIHNVNEGVGIGRFWVTSLDTGLVSVGRETSFFPVPLSGAPSENNCEAPRAAFALHFNGTFFFFHWVLQVKMRSTS
jgi:hypothetical protein